MEALEGLQLTTLEKLAQLAVEFGPFFFALVFLFVVTRTAYRRYALAQAENARDDDVDVATHKVIYIATSGFCAVLVILSLVWWFYHATARRFVEFSIIDVEEAAVVVSDSTYQRIRIRPPAGERPRLQDYDFVAVIDRWSTDVPVAQLRYWQSALNAGADFEIPLDLRARSRFRIRPGADGAFELVAALAATGSTSGRLTLVRPAAADEKQVIKGRPIRGLSVRGLPPPNGAAPAPPPGPSEPSPEPDGVELLIRQQMLLNEVLKGRPQP